MNPLDEVRQQLGMSTKPVPTRSTLPNGPGLAGILSASSTMPADLLPLRPLAVGGLAAAVVTAAGHRAFAGWALRGAMDDGNPVFQWMAHALTVGAVDVWGPFVAAAAALALLVAASRTSAFRSGRFADTLTTVVAAVTGGLTCLPIAVAVVIGVIALVVIIALSLLLLGLLFGLLLGAFD